MLGQPSLSGCLMDCLLNDRFVHVVAMRDSGLSVDVMGRRGEDPLPAPLAVGVRVLADQGIRQRRPASASADRGRGPTETDDMQWSCSLPQVSQKFWRWRQDTPNYGGGPQGLCGFAFSLENTTHAAVPVDQQTHFHGRGRPPRAMWVCLLTCLTTVATACASAASPSPTAPRPSAVLALSETADSAKPSACARLRRICSR